MLWPLLHYMIWNHATDGRLERMQWEAYATVNQLYADFVSEIYQEGDISNVSLCSISVEFSVLMCMCSLGA